MAAQTVSIEYLDSAGVTGRETILFSDTYTLTQIEFWLANGGLTSIDGVTGCQITDVEIRLKYDFSGDGLTGAPVTGSRYTNGALFGFRDTDGVAGGVFIPAVIEALVSGADVTDTGAVTDFKNHAALVGINDTVTDLKLASRSGALWDTFRYVDLKSRQLP